MILKSSVNLIVINVLCKNILKMNVILTLSHHFQHIHPIAFCKQIIYFTQCYRAFVIALLR